MTALPEPLLPLPDGLRRRQIAPPRGKVDPLDQCVRHVFDGGPAIAEHLPVLASQTQMEPSATWAEDGRVAPGSETHAPSGIERGRRTDRGVDLPPACAGSWPGSPGAHHQLWNRGASKLSLWVSAVSPLGSGCRHWLSSCLSPLRRHGVGPRTSPRRSLATEPKRWVLFLSASRWPLVHPDSPSASSREGSSDPDPCPLRRGLWLSAAYWL